MQIESLDNKSSLEATVFENLNVKEISKQFDSAGTNIKDGFRKLDNSSAVSLSNWLSLDKGSVVQLDDLLVKNEIKRMYEGVNVANGKQTLGLKEISQYKINEQYRKQNIKQQAGFAAEVASTAKENLIAQSKETGITTVRADDLPGASRNDQFVDKVRLNSSGEIIERIQTKFVGNNGEECLDKLLSKKFEKYYDGTKVDKIEIPKDYYDQIKSGNLIGKKIEKYQKQLDKVTELGKTEEIEKYQNKINHCKELETKLERSTVSSSEAVFAREHPKAYTMSITAKASHMEGLKSGRDAAILTGIVSTVDNVSKFMAGEVSAEDMVLDIVKDTGVAGAIGYGTGFVSTAISSVMKNSSHALIQSAGKLGVPAAVISFGVESYDSITSFATGEIDASELAYDLGENASGVAGGILGGMAMGAALGSVVPGAGTVAGAAAGIVGGLIGTAVASEAYKTAVETVSDVTENGVEVLGDRAQEMANGVVNLVTEKMPEMAGNVCSAINDFASQFSIPIKVSV